MNQLTEAARRARAALLDRINLHSSYQRVFSTPDGQRVLRHLMRTTMTKSSFVAGDPSSTAFKEGQRHMVLSVLRFVGKDQDKLIKQLEQELQQDENV